VPRAEPDDAHRVHLRRAALHGQRWRGPEKRAAKGSMAQRINGSKDQWLKGSRGQRPSTPRPIAHGTRCTRGGGGVPQAARRARRASPGTPGTGRGSLRRGATRPAPRARRRPGQTHAARAEMGSIRRRRSCSCDGDLGGHQAFASAASSARRIAASPPASPAAAAPPRFSAAARMPSDARRCARASCAVAAGSPGSRIAAQTGAPAAPPPPAAARGPSAAASASSASCVRSLISLPTSRRGVSR